MSKVVKTIYGLVTAMCLVTGFISFTTHNVADAIFFVVCATFLSVRSKDG